MLLQIPNFDSIKSKKTATQYVLHFTNVFQSELLKVQVL